MPSPSRYSPQLRVLALAWPVLVEQLLIMLVGLVDLWLTGRFLGEAELAAVGLMSYLLWGIPSLFAPVAIGSLALIARFVGQGDWEMARRVTNQALLGGLACAALATLALGLWGDAFIQWLKLSPEATPFAQQYLRILVPVVPAIMLEHVLIACLRGAGDTISGFVAMVIVNVVNIAVGASLVTGYGPAPELGWRGLAYGTMAGYATGGTLLLVWMLRGRAGLRIDRSIGRPDRELLLRIFRIGIPGGLDQMAIIACHLWFLSIINTLGTLASAAHGLAIRIESLAYLPGTAFQVAAATLAGQYLGANDARQATRSVLFACLVGGSLMSGAGLLFFFQGSTLASWFLSGANSDTARHAVPLLKIVAWSMPSLALSMILTGALRGAGDTRFPLLITLVGFLGVRLPLAYFLAWSTWTWGGQTWTTAGWGLVGAWYAMVADIILRSLLVLGRFLHGGWTRTHV